MAIPYVAQLSFPSDRTSNPYRRADIQEAHSEKTLHALAGFGQVIVLDGGSDEFGLGVGVLPVCQLLCLSSTLPLWSPDPDPREAHHGRRRVDVFQHGQVILLSRRQLAVKVDPDSEHLGDDVADAEVGDEDGVIHWQTLGHCSVSIVKLFC